MEIADLSHKEILKLDKDLPKAAKFADLTYVSDQDPGIIRIKKGSGFSYMIDGNKIDDEDVLLRIRKLAIPPAWTNVWICKKENGHIQATGLDVKGRKQYRYHPSWHALRNETKFHRLYEFGKLLPNLRKKLEVDFAKKELTEEKVIATIIMLMERTSIRIGNSDYEKLYGSHGLTTLKDKHVTFNGDEIRFSFKGKKGIEHDIPLKDRKLAKAVKACKDIPGKELFQYYDAEGNKKPVDSGMVNKYLKEATGEDFTAKDIRTWAGTINIMEEFKCIGDASSDSECKKNVIKALDEVSKKLGNSRTICKKYYVHPGIIKLYEENNLTKYLKELNEIEEDDNHADLTSQEKVLMKILKQLI
jgi:DNA topoisomerase-1